MKLGIQILNYNGRVWLPGLLQSLCESEAGNSIVYLVDNASTDGSVELALDLYPELRVIRNTENLGYASAYNYSIPMAFSDGCDWVCLLNQDMLLLPDWMSELERLSTDREIGVMGPAQLSWDSDEPSGFMQARYPEVVPLMGKKPSDPVLVDWIEGSAFLIARHCFERVGGFNPVFFMYWEEADFCRRARYHGFKVALVPGSLCRHFSAGSEDADGFMKRLKMLNHLVYETLDPDRALILNILKALRLNINYIKVHGSVSEFFRLLAGWTRQASQMYHSRESSRERKA